MTHKELIDRVRICIGDTDKTLIPDDARLRALANFAYQKVYKQIGIAMKDVLLGEVTAASPTILLPSEFYRARLVLVNGVQVNEVSFERAMSGYADGLNQSGDFNGLIQTRQLRQVVYYFNNSAEGRVLGAMPIYNGCRYEVFCVFDSIPNVQDSGSPYSEFVPPMFAEPLIYATVLEALPEMMSFEAAELRAERQKEYQVAMLREMQPNTQAQMQILLPVQIQTELMRQAERLRVIYEEKLEKSIKETRRNLFPSAKMPPKRYAQGLLDVYPTRSGGLGRL